MRLPNWTGGPWANFQGELTVYRRRSGELALDEAKSRAARFGLSGELQPDQGFITPQSGDLSVPGSPPAELPEVGGMRTKPVPDVNPTKPEPGDIAGQVPPEERESFVFYYQESGKRLFLHMGAGRFDYRIRPLGVRIVSHLASKSFDLQSHFLLVLGRQKVCLQVQN